MARMGDGKCGNMVYVGRPEGRKRLGIPGRRWENNIKKMWDGEARIGLIWLRCGMYGGCL